MLPRYCPTVRVRCDLCGDDNAIPIAYGRRFGIETINVICRTCGLVYQNPRLSEEQLGAFYRDGYRGLYSGSNEIPSPDFIQEQLARGKEILNFCRPYLKPLGLVLDVGAGPGGVLLAFREQGFHVMGVEPGPYGKWGVDNLGVDMQIGTLESMPKGISFDLVIFSFVLEHVPSPRAQLTRANSLLSPDGLVFVEVPDLRQIRTPIEGYFHIAHLTYFTPVTLRAMLETSGFALLKMENKGGYSVRALAIRKSVPSEVVSGIDWRVMGDDPMELEALLQRVAKRYQLASKIRLVAWPVLRICEIVIAKLLGDKAGRTMLNMGRRLWARIWYN